VVFLFKVIDLFEMKKLYSLEIYFSLLVSILLLTYFFVIPSTNLFFFDAKRLAEILLILFTLFSLSVSLRAQQTLSFYFKNVNLISRYALLSILILGILSANFSALVPTQSSVEIITLFSLLLVSLLCIPSFQFLRKNSIYFVLAMILSFGVMELQFMSYYVAFLLNDFPFSIHHFFFSFANPRFFNQYQIFTMPVVSCLVLSKHPFLQKTRIKYTLWSIAILWWLIFFTSQGRGVIVAVIISALIVAFIFRDKATLFLKQTIILFILGFITYKFLFDLVPYVISGGTKTLDIPLNLTSSGRLTKLWPDAINFILNSPWLGIGPMHYTSLHGGQYFSHPHNSILQIGAEWGVPALILVLFLIYRSFTAWTNKFNKHTLSNTSDENLFVLGLSFSLLSGGIYSLFSGVIVMPMSQVTATLVLGLAMSVYFPKYEASLELPSRNWGMTLLFGFLGVYYFWLLSPELIPQFIDPMYFSYHFLQPNSGPRFWQ